MVATGGTVEFTIRATAWVIIDLTIRDTVRAAIGAAGRVALTLTGRIIHGSRCIASGNLASLSGFSV